MVSSDALRTLSRRLIYLLLIGLAIHLIIPQIGPFRRSLALLGTMPAWILALATGAQVLSYVGTGYLNYAIVGLFHQRIDLRRAILIGLASGSAGEIAGGTVVSGAVTYKWVRDAGADADAATLSGWLPQFLNTGIHLTLGAFSLLHLLRMHDLPGILLIGSLVTALILTLILLVPIWAVLHESRLRRSVDFFLKQMARVRRKAFDPAATPRLLERVQHTGALLRHGGWIRPVLGALANVGFDLLTIALLFLAAGEALSPGRLLAGYAIPAMLGKLNLIPGGIGIVEASMTGLYQLVGVPFRSTIIVVLLYRLLSLWLPLAIGFLAAGYLERHPQAEPAGEGPIGPHPP